MKKSLFATLFLVLCLSKLVTAQMSDRDKFVETLYLMDDKRFTEAKVYLEDLLEKQPDNANLNYNYGIVLSNSFNDKDHSKALPYLAKAAENVSPNYTPYSPREKKAPVDVHYYYGKALHSENEFDKAIEQYKKFETYINEKHYLYADVENRIAMSKYAKVAIADPREIRILNLGNELNSIYPDYSPAIRIDESAIYFTSRRLRPDSSNLALIDPNDGMYLEDIYVSFKDNGKWGKPRLLNINSSGNEATLNLSVDGRTLYIYRGDNNDGALLESRLVSDSAGIEKWSKPKLLGSNINSKANESHVTISPDGRTLYFTSDREGGEGGMDIYFCRILPTGEWAEAVDIGPRLNTPFDEDGVYMHPDGKTLYFSSNGHPSIGGYDIMYSTKTDTGWTKPVNLGYPVNSVDDDVFFVTTPDGKRAYFSSFKEGGVGEKDLYMIQLLDADEISLTLYRGEFTYVNSKSPPKGATVTITNNYTGAMTGVYTPRQRDGQFSAILEPNNSYHFVYEADDFETYEEDIYVPEGASYQEIYKDIKLKPVRVGGSGMNGITPASLASASVSGALTTNDTAVKNQTLILTDEQGNVLYTTTTNDQGGFNFTELDPSKTYFLKLDGNDKASFLVYDLQMKNDRGEEIVYTKKDNKTIVFVPSKYPFEFYGISARAIAGTVRGANGPVTGLKVRLEDEEKNLVQQTETDKYGEFNFQKLSLENKYRLVFDGEFPEDPEITIINELGEELTFRKVGDGIFEYVPSGKAAKGSQIAGSFKKDGVPIAGVKVMLQDDNKNLLQQQVTDANGNFIFANLDLDKRYRILFDGEFPDGGELILYNEFGERLTFTETSKGVYEYIPAGANMGSEIAGVVSKNGMAVSGLNIKLTDAKSNVLQQAITDDKGEFHFSSLDLDKSYRILFDGDFPDGLNLILMNEFGQELSFHKVGDGVYEYIPGKKSKMGSEFQGVVSADGKPIGNLKVLLQNDKGETYQQAVTDSVGAFNFMQLDLNQSYVLLFEGDVPDNLEIVITNEYGQELTFVKTGDGRYEYIPAGKSKRGSVIAATASKDGKPLSGYSVNLRDAKGNIIETQETNDQGAFRFSQLSLDRRYQIEFLGDFPEGAIVIFNNEFGDELTFMEVRKGVFEFVPRPIGFPMKSYTLGVLDEVAYKDTYPQPNELKDVIVYFQKYFPYNAKDINEENTEFKSFVGDIAEIVKRRGFAQIIITSSASKVPTKTWTNNSVLSKRRAYDTKRLLEKVFKANGIEEGSFNFVDINTLITGPDYRNDPIKNKSTYEKHQYVRIFIK